MYIPIFGEFDNVLMDLAYGMETVYALLALCHGNRPVTSGFL